MKKLFKVTCNGEYLGQFNTLKIYLLAQDSNEASFMAEGYALRNNYLYPHVAKIKFLADSDLLNTNDEKILLL